MKAGDGLKLWRLSDPKLNTRVSTWFSNSEIFNKENGVTKNENETISTPEKGYIYVVKL